MKRWLFIVAVLGFVAIVASCGSSQEEEPTLVIGAIPDQQVSQLQRRFDLFTDYIEQEVGIQAEYNPSSNYAALVTAFERGEVHLAWFGGLTGVQARLAVPGAQAIAQRPRDQSFRSVIIVGADSGIETLEDLRGKRVTFGSESSTSGHLMPRYYLEQNDINPDEDFDGGANYSGSHDRTWKLVESGSYHAGLLSEAVWERAVDEGQVDQDQVRVLGRTHEYPNYHWTIHPEVDERFGESTSRRIREALLAMDDDQRQVLDLFAAEEFIPTSNDEYEMIRQTGQDVGVFR